MALDQKVNKVTGGDVWAALERLAELQRQVRADPHPTVNTLRPEMRALYNDYTREARAEGY
jgi:hypothetical protein